jgi:hypothetical protein
MKRVFGLGLMAILAIPQSGPVRADEKDAAPIIDKAIKALGGEEKLTKAQGISWKQKGTVTFNGNDNEFNWEVTMKGVDHYRGAFKGNFNENDFTVLTLINGDKGWVKVGDMDHDMADEELANEKRRIYLNVVPLTILPLKGKGFKTEAAGEEKVGDKPALVVKATGPDGKNFKLYFDKESGLPVRMVATVIGFGGDEYEQDSTYADYKEFDGIKKATKVDAKRDGEKFINMQVSEFKVLDKVDDAIFVKPKD